MDQKEELQEQEIIADGVMVVHLFKKGNKVHYRLNTFDRLNDNQPLGYEDLMGIGRMLAEVTMQMESKLTKDKVLSLDVSPVVANKPKLILP